MRLPNGFGSVVKMSGKRRNPYIVRKTVGWTYDEKKDRFIQEYKIIGYARTKADGLRMLAEYQEDPEDQKKKWTFSDVYEAWRSEKINTVADATMRSYEAGYKACAPLKNKNFATLRLSDLQNVFDKSDKNFPTMRKMKVLLQQLYAYAIKYDICDKDYAKFIDVKQFKGKNPNQKIRTRISADHLDVLWSHSDDPYIQVVLMLIYNGCRISEFLDLKKSDVNLDLQYFDVVKSKTENGIRRVPIADKTLTFYRSWFEQDPEAVYLITTPDGSHFEYHQYTQNYFKAKLGALGMEYTPHYTRHTCASMMADAGIEPTTQKKILGHSGGMTVTERVYTHLDVRTLIDAINRI